MKCPNCQAEIKLKCLLELELPAPVIKEISPEEMAAVEKWRLERPTEPESKMQKFLRERGF